MTDPRFTALPIPVWQLLALTCFVLYYGAVVLLCLCVLRRRKGLLALALALLPTAYVLLQGLFGLEKDPNFHGAVHNAVQELLRSLPPWLLLAAIPGLTGLTVLLCLRLLRSGSSQIVPMSVKEAVDNLPEGICCYLPGGQIILANMAMESLCQTASGTVLRSGEDLRRTLTEGPLAPGCRLAAAGDAGVLLLPNGEARALSFQSVSWEGKTLTAVQAADVTEAWQKKQILEERKEALSDLNRRLARRNREIVDLTIQSEILAARVRLHDAMGENLLTMKQLLLCEPEGAELEALQQRLQRNISFLKDDMEGQAEDEYSVLLKSAESLGVRIRVEGSLPETGALRQVIITGLHECLTNLLRHAHGDLLCLELREADSRLTAVFSGNGDPPAGPVRETGGLRTLRELTDQLGGTMTVTARRALCVTLHLPKEAGNGY